MDRAPTPRFRALLDAMVTWHPVAVATSYVLISFSATPLPPSAIVRPMLIAIGATVLVQAVLWILTRRRLVATAVTSALVLVLSAAWLPLGLLGAIGAWWLIVGQLRRRRGARPVPFALGPLGRAFAIVVWVMVVVAAVPVATIIAASATASGPLPEQEGEAAPDVVILMLDGYPRADALRRMGGNNGPFLAALDERGFTTASASRSNYTSTWATLASMFSGQYLEEIEALPQPYPDDPAAQYRALMAVIADAPALRTYRERGYEIVTMPPTLEGAQLTAADRVVPAPQMTAFELSLVQRSPVGNLALRAWPSIAYRQHRDRTEATLRLAADEIVRDAHAPRLVFAHVVSPHAPMVAAADGGHIDPPRCFPDCSMYVFGSVEDWERLPGQVAHLDGLVLDVVDRIVAARPEATVVLMSDHGMRAPGAPEADLLRTFFSIRTTDATISVPADIQPHQVLGVIAGERPASRPYRAWISAEERPLDLVPYAGPDP